jgi:predicted aconitase
MSDKAVNAVKVKRLIGKAVDAHRPLFNGEFQPSDFQVREAAAALSASFKAVDALVATARPAQEAEPVAEVVWIKRRALSKKGGER